jgi:hypothetical protein
MNSEVLPLQGILVLPELNIIICLDFLYLSVGEEIYEML